MTSVVPQNAPLTDVLVPGEQVLWIGRPDPVATLRTQLFWWWIAVPWLAISSILHFGGWIPADIGPWLFLIGLAFLAAPALMVVRAYGTVYAITNRRIVIKHDALGKREVQAWSLDAIDDRLEILETSAGIGHLYFASTTRKRVSDADYTGRVALRDLARPRDVAARIGEIRAGQRRQ